MLNHYLCIVNFSRVENSIGLMEAVLPYFEREKRERREREEREKRERGRERREREKRERGRERREGREREKREKERERGGAGGMKADGVQSKFVFVSNNGLVKFLCSIRP